jgi:3-deoxy-manno-octulosonate cytidylyltransferase (CMP-KDO synthetase)
MLKVLGIIPARFDSSRFPGKPLVDLKGKTMIQRVYEGAKKSNLLQEVIVATDDNRIYDEVIRFGGKVMMTDKNHPSGTDRCGEICAKMPNFDVIINIQGDEPLVDFRQIDSLVQAFEDKTVSIATLAIKQINQEDLINSNRIKVVTDYQNHALYFSRSCIPNHENFSKGHLNFYPYLRHIGLYAYRSKTLLELIRLKPTKLEQIESLEQLRWMYYGYGIKLVITEIETPNIDAPEDVAKVLDLL